MGSRRYALKKDGNQDEVVDALRAIGCSVRVMHAPCDLLVGYRLKNLLLEVKNPNAPRPRLTLDQIEFRREWRGQFDVVSSVDEALAAVRRWTT